VPNDENANEVIEPSTEEEVAVDGKSTRSPMNKKSLIEWSVVLVVALMASMILRLFVFQTFYIPSGSMEPTLNIGDRIVVNKLSVDFGTINRGDIVVFKRPPAEHCGGAPVADLVKRVLGLPGDRISSKGNTIYIDGKPVDEKWTHNEPLGTPITAMTVPKGQYFMIGDNHPISCDSRYWGTVPRSYIVGKVFLRVWPLSRFSWI
jgi:signal peptidase I